MEKPSIQFVYDIVDMEGNDNPYNNVIVKWLSEYRKENKIKDYNCLYCGTRLGFTAYFCHSPFTFTEPLTPQNAVKLMKRPKISRCAYEFYCQHPDKLVEWVTR